MPENTQNDGIHHKRIFVVLTVARQIEGEWQCIRSEKAFVDADKAEEYAKSLNSKYVVPNTRPTQKMAIKVTTEHGEIACQCLASVYEIELDGDVKGEEQINFGIIPTGPNFPHMEHPNIRY